jgi:hypothetical protein
MLLARLLRLCSIWFGLCGVLTATHAAESPYVVDDSGFRDKIKPFLETYCIACHGEGKTEGEFRVDRDINADITDVVNRARWSEVVNVLNSHEMPPEGELQPSSEEVAAVVDWVTEQVSVAEIARRDSTVILRRMNRAEYRNVIRDLVGVDFDTKHFPQDPPASGFDNIGSALTLSPMQLELYYESALKILDRAMVEGPKPKTIFWRIEPESGDSDANRVQFLDQRPIVNGGANRVEDGCKVLHHSNWDRGINFRDFALPIAGRYRIRIHAGAKVPTRNEVVTSADKFLSKRRDKEIAERPEREAYIRQDYERDLEHFRTDRMYDYGPPRIKVTRNLGGQPVVVAELDIDANLKSKKVFVIEAEFTTEKAGVTIDYAYDIPKELENFWFQSSDEFARPEAWIDWIELEGPIHDTWPPQSHTQLLLDDTEHAVSDRQHAEKVLKRFMSLAYRRPVTKNELADKLQLFDATSRNAASFNEAIKVPLTAVLVSSPFLFITETTPAGEPLSDFEIANRMSFFVWSSMPDRELLSLAFAGKLQDPAVRAQQLNRMLADPKCESFVSNFAGQWLGLREVGANPPAPDLYRRYDRHLETSIAQESLAFFREILHHDLNVLNFVDSDFVVINERLGRFYDIPNVRGDYFRRVLLPPQHPRGGVMTQASVLTITSNGTRTSPVKRGTWILKNILGSDPGLPVANAGEIAPKVPGIDKATVRQRLEIHRELPQCARCHNKIDPLGFALENFDASGDFRLQEGFGYKGRIGRDDPPIDASSRLPDGTELKGINDLKKAILAKDELFLNCLVSKMLTYALGRETTLSDRPTINSIVADLKSSQPTLRSMMQLIIASDQFLKR